MSSATPEAGGMVERVAAAIYGANIKHVGWRSAGPGWHKICREQARAALEAMREPTPDVSTAILIAAGRVAEIFEGEVYIRGDAGEFIAAAMVDKALDLPRPTPKVNGTTAPPKAT